MKGDPIFKGPILHRDSISFHLSHQPSLQGENFFSVPPRFNYPSVEGQPQSAGAEQEKGEWRSPLMPSTRKNLYFKNSSLAKAAFTLNNNIYASGH